ncbi:tudor domain-containing 6, partial [Pholidichthys leucotaenia]
MAEDHKVSETSILVCDSESEMTSPQFPSYRQGNMNVCMYKWPNIPQNTTEKVYASCIVGPHYFWCQYTNTEDLNAVLKLAQEAGQAKRVVSLPERLELGSPCLALFSHDNQWYRAQVIEKADNTLRVLFVDYGNEEVVDIKNVRLLPQSLLDLAPRALLCSLNGFKKSEGSWDDCAYHDFYNILIDKPLKLTVWSKEDYSEIAVPQYAVEIECEGVNANTAMEKYWSPVREECITTRDLQKKHSGSTESTLKHVCDSEENDSTCMYKEPQILKNKVYMVHASSVSGPQFFWCQNVNIEDLSKISKLARGEGQASQDIFFPETLNPGSPCLALFSTDQQWYRAQVMKKTDCTFHVVFIDYGNESEVDIKDIRPLPQSLLEIPPQAFLCCLNGFTESEGSWDDEVYDDFYNLVVDKPLQ